MNFYFNYLSFKPHLKLFVKLILLFSILLAATSVSVQATDTNQTFNHDDTEFPLDFRHSLVSCASCHKGGVFKGVPTQCSACHSLSSRIQASAPSPQHISTTDDCQFCHQTGNWTDVIKVDHFAVTGSCQSCHDGVKATGKNPGHIQSNEVCDDCHRTFTWAGAVFDHDIVVGGCINCHNGAVALGKNPTHILSTDTCEDCHRTIGWLPVTRIDHTAVTGSCISCHNGVTATSKPPNHIASSNDCELCHSSQAWLPATFDHTNIVGNCFSCHNGGTATSKPLNHIASSNNCELCHSSRAWLPATFDHNNIVGNCSSCHNGITATGTNASHFITARQCDSCHNTTNWTTNLFVHQSIAYPGDHQRTLLCTDCHGGNSDVVSWRNPAYQPDCAACHANNFIPNPHKKTETPATRYTVSELRDCSGSCHIYTDSSLTVILDTRNNKHRVSDGGW